MTNADAARTVIDTYYAAFNRGDWQGMLDCLADDVAHDVNQGSRQTGKPAFAGFLAHMERCYRERLSEIAVMVAPDGRRAAAEFVVDGTYCSTDEGLPPAAGQTYRLPAATLFALTAETRPKIVRVTTYYNLQDWLKQVGA